MAIIYFTDIREILEEQFHILYDVVSQERKKKILQYKLWEDKKRCLCGEALIRYGLAKLHYLKDTPIFYHTLGKPYVEGCGFSVSHSGNWVLVAFSESDIGVDIEKITNNTEGLSCFSDEEVDYISCTMHDEQCKRFTEIWTRKECYLKYLGLGLHKKLNSFSTIQYDSRGRYTDKENRNIFLKSFLFKEDYYCSICSNEEKIVFKQVSIFKLINFFIN